MAINYPGPYVLRIFYTALAASTGSMQHVHNLNLDLHEEASPGNTFDDLHVVRRNGFAPGVLDVLTLAVQNYVAIMAGMFHTSTNIDYAELWKMTPLTTDGVFISAYTIDEPGVSGTATSQAAQSILTYRTLEGGTMQQHFMETIYGPGPGQSLNVSTGAVGSMRDFILSEENWVLAKDTSYPFAALRFLPGSSEALFKKRFRTN